MITEKNRRGRKPWNQSAGWGFALVAPTIIGLCVLIGFYFKDDVAAFFMMLVYVHRAVKMLEKR